MSLEVLAALLEREQAQRDYRATWFVRPYSMDAEDSAWQYMNSAYRVWAEFMNEDETAAQWNDVNRGDAHYTSFEEDREMEHWLWFGDSENPIL